MKKILIILFAILISVNIKSQNKLGITQDHYRNAERTYQDSTGYYIIKFLYNSQYCMIPSTYPSGQPHYSAIIEVYKIIDGKEKIMGKSFGGIYTSNGCFEDDPKYLIKEALKLEKKKNKKKIKK